MTHVAAGGQSAQQIKDRLTLALCAALLLLFAILSYSAVVTKSATYDETEHSISGYVVRNFGDYRINPQDPALFARIAALPHGAGALKFDPEFRTDLRTDPLKPEQRFPVSDFRQVLNQHDFEWVVSVNTLYHTPGNDPDDYINRSRFVFMLIGLAAGALVCWWAWKLAGRLGAFAATALYALDPNFIGHAPLVKNDVSMAMITVALMFALWRFGRRGTGWNLAAIVACCAAVVNVKCSGPILFGFVFLVLSIRALMSDAWPVLRWELKTRLKRLAVPFAVCFIAGVVTFVVIWACYGFRYSATPDPSLHFNFEEMVNKAKLSRWQAEHANQGAIDPKTLAETIANMPTPAIASLVQWMMSHKLLPEAWLAGYFYTYASTIMRGSFLNGDYSITGWWYFFPLCILYKAPVATVIAMVIALPAAVIFRVRMGFGKLDILLGAALVLLLFRVLIWLIGPIPAPVNSAWNILMILLVLARIVPALQERTSKSSAWAAVCLATPVVIYGGLAMAGNLNLGIRHVLPLLPFIHLGIAIGVAQMIRLWGRYAALVAGGLGVALAIESCSAWPNYIAFFNAFIGGPTGGLAKLSDSNLDWGQDLKLVADWYKKNPNKQIYFSYFGMADPAYYGIKYINLPGGYLPFFGGEPKSPQAPGVLIISATNLQGVYLDPETRKQFLSLSKLQPREILGGTTYIYDWPLRVPQNPQQ